MFIGKVTRECGIAKERGWVFCLGFAKDAPFVFMVFVKTDFLLFRLLCS
jgi:hypothetical protein